WCFSIVASTSSMTISSGTVTTGCDMQNSAVYSSGFLPLATTRQTMYRTVTTAIGIRFYSSATIGISPQSWSTIIWATRSSGVSGVQQVGWDVITSLAD